MMLPEELLDLPAPRGVRLVALERLDALVEARVRLGHAEDVEALHDFRVALRRLRSVLRAYRRPLAATVGEGTRERLRRLAAATTQSRDLEVHIGWLDAQRETLTPRQRVGYDALRATLAARKAAADERLERVIHATFPHLAHRLRERFLRYDAPVIDGPRHADAPFAAVMSTRTHKMTDALRRALDAVHGAGDENEAHRARIAAKRLRYLLEPVAGIVPGADVFIARVKALQDQLGALHDAHVFAPELVAATETAVGEHARRESLAVVHGGTGGRAAKRVHARDPRPGLIALGERVRALGEAAFAEVQAGWLGGNGAAFFADAAKLADAIDEHARPVYEIERKYLLDRFPAAAAGAPAEEIEQGWLPGAALRERIRRVTTPDGVRYFRAIKTGAGLVRTETEEETTLEVFEALWPLTEGRRVHKQRHKVRDGDLTWEIDHFLDRDLTLAEVELPSAETKSPPPDWLQPHVMREVTEDPAYVNYNLGK